MKKTKVLAFALSAAIMVMGAGYAAWNDTVTINNTVKTGNFDVTFVDASGAPIGDVITKEDLNLYPGKEYKVEAKLKNVGTINANLTPSDIVVSGLDPAIVDEINIVKNFPASLAPNATGDVVVSFTVKDTAPQNLPASTISIDATYNQ